MTDADRHPRRVESVDDWLDRFDLGWQPGLFAEYVRHPPPAVDARAAVFELVKIDLERRWKSGDRPRIEEYLTRDVRLGAAAEVPVHVIRAEMDARERYGLPLGADELRPTTRIAFNIRIGCILFTF